MHFLKVSIVVLTSDPVAYYFEANVTLTIRLFFVNFCCITCYMTRPTCSLIPVY